MDYRFERIEKDSLIDKNTYKRIKRLQLRREANCRNHRSGPSFRRSILDRHAPQSCRLFTAIVLELSSCLGDILLIREGRLDLTMEFLHLIQEFSMRQDIVSIVANGLHNRGAALTRTIVSEAGAGTA